MSHYRYNNNRGYFTSMTVHSWTIILLLFAGAVKNDAAELSQSEFWSDISRTYMLSFIKNNIYAIYIILLTIFLYSISSLRSINFRVNSFVLLFVLTYFYGFLRGMYTDFTFSAKMLFGFLLFFCLYIYIYSLYITFKVRVSEIIDKSFYVISVILISLNIIEYVAGGGFVPGVTRYFGSSSHPNFIGVQMAVCCVAVVYNCKENSRLIRMLSVILFLMGLFILYISGSRTAIVILLAEILGILIFDRRRTFVSFIAIHFFILTTAAVFLFYSDHIFSLL